MTGRYCHYLRRCSRDRWPPRVLCVEPTGIMDVDRDSGAARRETLAGWRCMEMTLRDHRYDYYSAHAGANARQWWRLVYDRLCLPGPTWILSANCPRVWPLLSVWAEIEAGTLALCPDVDRARHLASEYVRTERRRSANPIGPIHGDIRRRAATLETGYVVAEDRTSILVAHYMDAASELHWVDIRNYGAESSVMPEVDAPLHVRLARWWRDWHSALFSLSLGSAQHTAGSQALHGYRRGYYTGGIYCHSHPFTIGLEQDGYYGGRCECFRLGQIPGETYHYDYRALYPWVMQQKLLPTVLDDYTGNADTAARWLEEWSYRCIARVTVECNRPLFPYRRERDIIYPIGRFETVLAGPELEMACRVGSVRRVAEAARYHLGLPLADYARVLFQWRSSCESGGQAHLAGPAKALLVALPGKLGQRSRRWVPAPGVIPDYPWGVWYGRGPGGVPCRYRCLGSHVQREESGGWAPDAVPQIAAWVTSAGRVRLLDAIRAAGWENVYYVDTDCVVTNYAGVIGLQAADLCDRDRAGYLRRKHGPVSTEIRGIKYYLAGDRVACAGLPRGEAVDVGDGRHYWWRPAPSDTIYHGHRPDSRELRCAYPRTLEYRHGVVSADGRVSPIRLEG